MGIALDSLSTQQLWVMAYFNFMLISVSFGCNYERYHPEFMRHMNGDNAMLGPTGSSVLCINEDSSIENEDFTLEK